MKETIHGCGGTFDFLDKSEKRVAQFRAVAVKFLHLSREESCAKGKGTGAELFVEDGFVQRGGCEVQERQRDPIVRQLLSDASRCLIALFSRSGANEDDGDMGYLTIFYVREQPMLLNVTSARAGRGTGRKGGSS